MEFCLWVAAQKLLAAFLEFRPLQILENLKKALITMGWYGVRLMKGLLFLQL